MGILEVFYELDRCYYRADRVQAFRVIRGIPQIERSILSDKSGWALWKCVEAQCHSLEAYYAGTIRPDEATFLVMLVKEFRWCKGLVEEYASKHRLGALLSSHTHSLDRILDKFMERHMFMPRPYKKSWFDELISKNYREFPK